MKKISRKKIVVVSTTKTKIAVQYLSIDGVRDTRGFKTLSGAQKFAHRMVGEHPDIGRSYAVSFDGIGIVYATGCTLPELFPAKE